MSQQITELEFHIENLTLYLEQLLAAPDPLNEDQLHNARLMRRALLVVCEALLNPQPQSRQWLTTLRESLISVHCGASAMGAAIYGPLTPSQSELVSMIGGCAFFIEQEIERLRQQITLLRFPAA